MSRTQSAKLGNSFKDGAIVIVCAAHAFVFWMVARDTSTESHERLIGSISAQISLSPSSIVAGKILEDKGNAEIGCSENCNCNDSRTAAAIGIK